MADVTLSQAVRSNLLNLQSTAQMMGKTQERLATGLKVNSALDNPTNFFTASSLNSRASDLSQLLDSVSNAVQTIAAADKGISAITKLVESAQATARQALQTAATVGGEAADTARVRTANTTGLTISAGTGGTPEVLAEVDSADLTSVTISASTPAEAATGTGATLTGVDLASTAFSSGQALEVEINGETIAFEFFDSAASEADPTTTGVVGLDLDFSTASIDDALAAIQSAVRAADFDGAAVADFTIGINAGDVEFSMGTNTTDSVTFGMSVATALGIDGSHAPTPASGTAGSFTINGQTVTLAASDDADAIFTAIETAATASTGTNAFTVTNDNGTLTITGTDGNDVVIAGLTADQSSALGLSNGTTDGTVEVPPTGAQTGSITINGQSVTLASGDTSADILASLQAAATASSGTSAFTVTNSNGRFSITGTDGNDVVIAGDTQALDALGLEAGTTEGTPSVPGTANPKRAELAQQYNDLLSQIDQLAKDAGFNGVNLLNGDSLEVLFNEDGSSKLAVTGVTFDAAGLNLSEVATDGFNSNAGINETLDGLKAAIDDLRVQASKFGSNLSVVETRQDFTKNMINVLETGAANLTLADTNEEAANLLALQTRQQLSSTALSLASQADQNVLRLF